MSKQKNSGINAALLVIAAYLAAMLAAVLMVALMMIIVEQMNIRDCQTMGQVMLGLLIAIAAVFAISVWTVRSKARSIISNNGWRLAAVIAHAAALLTSYLLIVFTLLVAFNC